MLDHGFDDIIRVGPLRRMSRALLPYSLHAAATVRATRTEDGGVCTMALPARLGKLPRDAKGRPVAIDDLGTACALVHQYDRDAALHAHFRALYPE